MQIAAMLRRGHTLGVAFGAYACGVVMSADGWSLVCAGLCTATSACMLCFRRSLCKEALELAAIAAAMMLLGSTCALSAVFQRQHVPYAALDERRVRVDAISLERPRAAPTGAQLRVRIIDVLRPVSSAARSAQGQDALLEVSQRVLASLPDGQIDAGHVLRISARANLPAGVRNEGEPSQRDILGEQGIALVLSADAAHGVVDRGTAYGPAAWWARLRSRCAASLERRLPPLHAAVLEGILWGDRGNLPQQLRQEFSDTGTVHVLTTAGLHLGIMAALVAWLLDRLPWPRALRLGLTLLAAWAYAALAGLHLPTVRAATMLTSGMIAHESGRARTSSAVLSAAAFAVVLPHPLALLSPSFSMSFACVSGIALLSPLLAGVGMHERDGVPQCAIEIARTSIAVQLALWPFQALYFNAFTPYAVLANVLVVPMVGVLMAVGALLTVSSICLPLVAASLANLTWWASLLLTWIVQSCAKLPFAHLDVPPPTHAFLVFYWLVLAGLAWIVQRKPARTVVPRAAACAALLLALIYCLPGIAAALDRDVHLDAIDVGQADCLLVRAPGGHAMLIDGGGRLERASASGGIAALPIGDRVAGRTVIPFLMRHWVLHLDAVVLTHPHGDHAGGLPLLLERENVGALFDSAQLYGGPAYRRALDVVRERHIRWLQAIRGEHGQLGDEVAWRMLGPERPLLSGTSSDINNNSVVLRIQYKNVGILLTGDAQSEAEERLLSHGAADLRANILKVGHHGSAYSSTRAFLQAVDPQIAIISCGKKNVFGHPSPRTLSALRAVGARVYRTDLDGGISLGTDGLRVWGSSAAKPQD